MEHLTSASVFYQGNKTGKDGKFVFEQVFPGTSKMTRIVSAGNLDSSWSSFVRTIEVKSGETTYCTIGGDGKSVVGQAVAPETINWQL
ncbi:MAG: hypothetical protein LBP59_00425 [Planctomycetaceae bacterium]|jgi:hypothetical protein|nr:hypothetical protein [Planctomycetaceae bacterium]